MSAIWLALLVGAVVVAAAVPAADAYKAEIEDWRAKREAGLKSETGWLTVAGLFWLHEGDNRAGTDEEASIVLPKGAKSIGSFRFATGKVTFVPSEHAAVLLNGNPVTGPVMLKSDEGGVEPDVLTYEDTTMFVIKRGTRHAVRMRDKNSKMRREFTGEHWYPVREDMRFEAKFVSYPEPKLVPIPNILNEVEHEKSIGYAVFTYHGHEYTLEPVIEEDHLFYIFKDQTAGKETYGAGRFLYSEMPKNGHVILDFNQAVNPPCSFTPFATCPLPPKQNRLAVRIEAGELKYGDHH